MTCISRIASLVGAAAGLTVLVATGHAGQPTSAQVAAVRASCPADYKANCAGVPTGGQAALACLQQNLAKLSTACQTAVSAATGTAPAAPAAAATPAVPATATPAAPAASAATPAPAPVRSAPMSPRQEIFLLRTACSGDYRAVCGGVRPGGGRAIACLEANRASLSQGCTSAILAARQR